MISSPPRRLYRKLPPEDTQAHTLLEAVWRKGRIGWSRATLEAYLLSVLAAPLHCIDDPQAGELARYLTVLDPDIYLAPELDAWPNLSDSDDRMEAARRLPISVYGVLLPGRQAGYGLPVGGVLATLHHPKLPKELYHWAWLLLDSEAGQEYWRAMGLCLAYSLACHHWRHSALAKELEVEAAWSLSCPHNFASLEIWRGQEVVVHRKGAIRLGPGETGIICGTMTAPTALVRGTDSDLALHSASHGVARAMSRSTARRVFRRRELDQQLKQAGVTLASGQADEWPGVYGNAECSLAAHAGLLETFGSFEPRFVRMCVKNDPAED